MCGRLDELPLLINMRPFLASTATITEFQWPEWYFPGLVFHELMHHYVGPVSPVSKLRRKYSTEVPQTVNHLHVMALEKVVFSRLRLSSE